MQKNTAPLHLLQQVGVFHLIGISALIGLGR